MTQLGVHSKLEIVFHCLQFKGSPDQSHFIFEINVGKSRIRHITTLNLNDISSIDFASIQKFIILFQSRCLSDPTPTLISKIKWLWSELSSNGHQLAN